MTLVSAPLRYCAVIAFFSMISCGLMLPSDGNHGILSPKSLSFFAAAGSWVLYLIALRHYMPAQLAILATTALATALLLLWMELATIYGETPFNNQFDQFKVFLITLLTVTMALFYLSTDTITPQQLIRGAIYANFAYSTLKVLAALLQLFGILDILTFGKITGIRLMSMDIHGGMIRLQTSVDIVTPFLLLFVLQHRQLKLNLPRGFASLYLAVALLAVLLSFSRYLMFVSALAFCFHWLTLTPIRQVWGICISVAILIATTAFVGGDAVYKVIEKRLFSSDNYHSDRTRFEQIAALEEEALAHPLLGKGLGASAPSCIRDSQLPYSYEVQWVAFTMQIGILGTALLATALLTLGWRYCLPPHTLSKVAFITLYLMWLLSGFTNPFLISLTSGIVYALFWAGSLCLSSPTRLKMGRRLA